MVGTNSFKVILKLTMTKMRSLSGHVKVLLTEDFVKSPSSLVAQHKIHFFLEMYTHRP